MSAIKYFDKALQNEVAPKGIVSFELAKNIKTSEAVLNSWNVTAKSFAGLSLGIDFLFLLLYAGFIAFSIYLLNSYLWNENLIMYQTGKLMMGAIILAAVFDAIENVALIRLLTGDLKQIWSSLAYYASTIKFSLVGLSILYLLINLIIYLYRKLIKP